MKESFLVLEQKASSTHALSSHPSIKHLGSRSLPGTHWKHSEAECWERYRVPVVDSGWESALETSQTPAVHSPVTPSA